MTAIFTAPPPRIYANLASDPISYTARPPGADQKDRQENASAAFPVR
jgi:hypothetical protein